MVKSYSRNDTRVHECVLFDLFHHFSEYFQRPQPTAKSTGMITRPPQEGAQQVKDHVCTKKSVNWLRLWCAMLEMIPRASTEAVRTGTKRELDAYLSRLELPF